MRKISLVVVDRANWGRLQCLAAKLRDDDRFALDVIAGGSTVLSRFKQPADDIAEEGFHIASRLFHEVEGGIPETMARSVGLGVIEFTGAFERSDPDIVLLIGDRYEALSAAIAAAYSNRCLVHIQGGEVSGSIDESARHAITKLAHYHIPATQRAARYLVRMGEHPETILCVGCPGADITPVPPPKEEPYFLVVYHPDTTRHTAAQAEMHEVLTGISSGARHRHVRLWWPNIDAGAEGIAKVIRQNRGTFETIKNLPPAEYAGLLAGAECAIGNSSSFVRDSSRFGTPVVLVGSRQNGREWGANVLPVAAESRAIATAIQRQLKHGRYDPDDLYGRPGVSAEIVEALANLTPYHEKKLSYA